MAELDRADLIMILGRLADPDDATALAAARQATAAIAASGKSWDEILRPVPGVADEEDEEPAEAPLPPEDEHPSGDTLAADALLLDALLSRDGLSEETRADLTDLRAAIAAGEFATMDSRYLRALAKRLNG